MPEAREPVRTPRRTAFWWATSAKASVPMNRLMVKPIPAIRPPRIQLLMRASFASASFGLSGGTERTLEEVGAHFGVTRERVRQIQNIALGKLRRMIEKLETVKK